MKWTLLTHISLYIIYIFWKNIILPNHSALSQCDEKLGTMECQENNNSNIPKNFLYLTQINPAKLWRLPHCKWLASWVRSSANYQLCKKIPITSFIKKCPTLVLCGGEIALKEESICQVHSFLDAECKLALNHLWLI